MIPTICATLEHAGPVITCPDLSTLSIQCNSLPCTGHILRMAAQRSDADCRIARLVVDRVRVARAAAEHDEIAVDDGELASLLVYIDDVEVGMNGICEWEQRPGWDFENEHWRLPVGDEPRCVFPWQAEPVREE